jgi:hypothetical protein
MQQGLGSLGINPAINTGTLEPQAFGERAFGGVAPFIRSGNQFFSGYALAAGSSAAVPALVGLSDLALPVTALASVRESRILFELKVLAMFLREIFAHPRTTSRMSVDSQRRSVVVERD